MEGSLQWVVSLPPPHTRLRPGFIDLSDVLDLQPPVSAFDINEEKTSAAQRSAEQRKKPLRRGETGLESAVHALGAEGLVAASCAAEDA